MTEKNTPWWKYLLAVLFFWLSPAFVVGLLRVVLSVLNFLTPALYQHTENSLTLLAQIVGVILCCDVTGKIMEQKHPKFCMVNCIIASVLWVLYLLIYIASCFMFGGFAFFSLLSLLAVCGMYIYSAVQFSKEI